jgi:hypothetical protein
MVYFTGGDYCTGIKGVGLRTALGISSYFNLEIVSNFSNDRVEGLKSFKEWWSRIFDENCVDGGYDEKLVWIFCNFR